MSAVHSHDPANSTKTAALAPQGVTHARVLARALARALVLFLYRLVFLRALFSQQLWAAAIVDTRSPRRARAAARMAKGSKKAGKVRFCTMRQVCPTGVLPMRLF